MVNNTETKNTTILALDVVNYSVKMKIDEKGTTEKLKKSRKIIEKFVKTSKQKDFFEKVKLVCGDNPLDTLKGTREV